jgi:methyl acetate hydrolase
MSDAFTEAVRESPVPGGVVMAANDREVLYARAFGVRDAHGGRAMGLDAVFRIASMTKAITSVAAMQLVEQGKLDLDVPVPPIDRALASPMVLEGFEASGHPRLRPARGPITLRQLLTHTAGFTYEMWDRNTIEYLAQSGTPSFMTGRREALRLPLAFDPGERWCYGISTDWVGQIIEALSGVGLGDYFRTHIFGPLEMRDTGYVISPEQRGRQAVVFRHRAGGAFEPRALETPFVPEFYGGGGGLYSTATDYLTFLRMFLGKGRFQGARILQADTVDLMCRNNIGNLTAGILSTAMPNLSRDLNLLPGSDPKWGLGFMINTKAKRGGRSAGSSSWAGLLNTHYWIDPSRRIAGVFMTQVQPFGDPAVMQLYDQFERHVYALRKAQTD